jgi:GNAT superfamily N-acetyltransferase
MDYRFAVAGDAKCLAPLNAQLIRDEGNRNSMTIEQLEQRLANWLARGEYEAVVFEEAGIVTGYALFRRNDGHIYLRQLVVKPDFRRRGISRQALVWLWANAWSDATRLRIDVLVGNRDGQAFWQSIGFQPYCVTMEMASPFAEAS